MACTCYCNCFRRVDLAHAVLIVNYTFGDRFCRRAGFAAERKEFAPCIAVEHSVCRWFNRNFLHSRNACFSTGRAFGTRRNRPSFCDEHIACADGTSDVGGNSNHSFRQFGAGKKPFNRRRRCVHIRNNCRIVCFALCAADSFCFDGDCC